MKALRIFNIIATCCSVAICLLVFFFVIKESRSVMHEIFGVLFLVIAAIGIVGMIATECICSAISAERKQISHRLNNIDSRQHTICNRLEAIRPIQPTPPPFQQN